MPTLSIVIPAYNEERFIGTVLERIGHVDLESLGFGREVLVIDDGSTDRTAAIAAAVPGVILQRMPVNGGKGRAVRAGIAMATGEYLIIQDADLEYDPDDYLPMLQAMTSGKADVVYGSRYLARGRDARGREARGHEARGHEARGHEARGWDARGHMGRGRHVNQSLAAYAGGRSLSVAALLFTGRYLTDTVTALKLFRTADIAAVKLETSGFEVDHEITAKLVARGRRIVEVPIRYAPRSREEGKKIRARDWFIGVRTLFRYRNG